jgi:serine protease Do
MNQASLKSTRLVLALLAAGVIGGAGVEALHNYSGPAHAATLPPMPAATVTAPANASGVVVPDFPTITKRYGPAVVNISVSGTRKADAVDPEEMLDPFELFKRFQQGQGHHGGNAQRDVPVRGMGSGFIVGADGIIMTNAHVVKDANEVTVKLTDRREYRAKVLGSDPKTDIAILKIDARNLPVVTLGSTKNLQVGEWVLAIGSPFGFDNTVTAGVVSAKGRSLPDDSAVPFIQTDVAVNPGNSGGPLFNPAGEVIGINTAIYSPSGASAGIGFATPSDLARPVVEQLKRDGRVERGWLGVSVQDLVPEEGRTGRRGVLIAGVERNSPAGKAGLRQGDVVVAINGDRVETSRVLVRTVAAIPPGQTLRLTVVREGRERDLPVQVGRRPSAG